MPNDPVIRGGRVITGPTDLGANAIGAGEREGPVPNFPTPRPVNQIEQPINVAPDTTNEYEALVPVPDPNEYVALANQTKDDQKIALQQSFFAAKDDDPDKKAKIINIANRLNLPPPFVEKNLESLEQKTPAVNDYDSLIHKTPGLAKFLENPDNAGLAKDDLENLGKVDQANGFFNQVKNFPKELGQAWKQGTFQSASSIWNLAPLAHAYGLIDSDTLSKAADNIASENKSSAELAAKEPAYLSEFEKLREIHGDHGEAWKQFVAGFPELKNGEILQALKDFGSGGIKTVGNALSLISDLATNPRASVYQLAEMTPFGFAMAPGAMAGGAAGVPLAPFTAGASIPIGSTIGAFANSAPMLMGGKINDLLKQSGVDVTNADSLRAAYSNTDLMSEILGKAQRSGLTMAAVQALFMPFAGKFLGAAEAAGTSKVIGAAKDIGIQSAGLTASDVAAQTAENKGDVSKVDPMQSLANGLLGLAHSAGSEAVGHSFRSELHPETAEAAKEIANRTQEAMETVQNGQALQEMNQGLKESKVGDRLPEKLAELINGSGQDHKVYFQTDDWDQYWKTKGISPVEAAQKVLGDAAPYLEAKNTGANLEIPIADMASSLGKTEHFENLISEARSEPDGPNLKEADETLKNLPATMEELAKEATQVPSEKSADEIKANIKSQLVEAGTLPADADKQASLYGAAFKSLGERTGQDPKALFDQYLLKIGRPKEGETPPILGPNEKTLFQTAPEQSAMKELALENKKEVSPLGFYSKLHQSLSDLNFDKIPAKDLINKIQNLPGVKKDEVEWSGITDWLKEAGDKVSKADVLDYLKNNGVKVDQAVGGSKAGTVGEGFDWSPLHHLDLNEIDPYGDLVAEEARYYIRESEDAFEDEKQNFKDELQPQFTKENGEIDERALDKAVIDKLENDDDIQERAQEMATESLSDPNSSYARFRTKAEFESPDGDSIDVKLEGSDDYGWSLKVYKNGRHLFQEDFNGGEDEAKIQAFNELVDRGLLSAEFKKTPESEIEWDELKYLTKHVEPTARTINPYFKEHKARLVKEITEAPWRSKEDLAKMTKKEIENEAKRDAEYELREQRVEASRNKDDPDNSFSIKTMNPFFRLEITGSAKSGFSLIVKDKTELNAKLQAKNIELAKQAAIEHLKKEGFVGAGSAKPSETNAANSPAKFEGYALEGGTNYREFKLTLPNLPSRYKSGHFSEPNIVVHFRTKDRTSLAGERILHVDEIQSDWHQQGREYGYEPTGEERSELNKKSDEIVKQRDEIIRDVTALEESAKNMANEKAKTFENEFLVKKSKTSGYWEVYSPHESYVETFQTKEGAIKHAASENRAWTNHGSYRRAVELLDKENPPEWASLNKDLENLREQNKKLNKELQPIQDKLKSSVPKAPYSDTDAWLALALKRILSIAAQDNYDKIIWSPGEAQVDRYNLAKYVRDVKYQKIGDAYQLEIADHNGNEIPLPQPTYKESELGHLLGKDVADKIIKGDGEEEGDTKILTAEHDLKVGGEGHKYFYDKKVPSVSKDILKKLDPNTKLQVLDTEKLFGEQLTNGENKYKDVWGFDVSPELKARVLEGQTLFQQGEQGPRGQIRFGNNKQFNIDLLKNADMSTVLHETGHFYLELMRDIGSSDKATPEIKQDLSTIHDWLGVKEGEAPTVEQHEKFARGFEAYLMEGKAPSSALKKAFDAFKIWLTNIYRSIKNLKVDLTPEVRQVFDRLLASEDEIKATEVKQNMDPLFPDPIKSGMSETQAARYIKARDDAREASENELSNKLLEDVRKKATTAYKAKESATREEVTKQIDDTNLYKAINQLQGKEIELGRSFDLPKLARSEVTKLYGKDFIQKLPKGIFAKKGEGLSADMIAELSNFHSGDDMLTQFANAPDRKMAIEAATKAKMQEENPDLLTSDALPEAAMKAVHNDKQATLLRMELEHLASNNMPVLKDVIRKVARRVPTEKAIRDQAERIIGSKNIEEAKPYLFERAERKAAKDAGELLAKGDIDGAFQAKQKELLNHELWKAANTAQEDIESSLKRFKKLAQSDEDLSKTRDTDLVNAARSLLSMYGVGKFSEDTPESFLKKMKAYDEEGYYTIKNLLDALTEKPKPYDQLTYDEFSHLKDTVDGLWSLSRSERQMEIDGKKVDRNEVIQKLSNRFAEVDGPKERAQYEKAKTGWDKTKMVLLGIKAALTRVEHWAAALDKGSIEGPFQTHLVRPIMDAISKYRLQKDEYLKNVQEILSPLKGELGKKSPIRSDELGYEFSGKAELLGALLHTGNESNFDKLLRGNGWEKENFDAFIRRMIQEKKLGKSEFDTIQKIWDLFEAIKPQAQKVHKEMYGFHFNEITSKPFSNEFGDYRGGYAPAIADPLRAPDANIRNEKEMLEKFNNSWMFPSTGRGFTKGRVQEYAAPLMMDLRLISSHIDKVLRFVNIEPRVKDTSKVVMNREFRNILDAHDPTVAGDLLIPWLQRAAQQRMNTPSQGWAGKGSDIFFRELRTRSGLNSLVGNLGHILHVATTGIPTGLVLVDPAKMRDSLWSYIKAPKETLQAITEKSDFMKARTSHQTSQIMEDIDELIMNPSKYQQVKAAATKYGYYIQQTIMNQSDSVIWNAAYNQAIEKGLSEKSAIAESDSVIRRTQHASNPEDVSKFETGTPFVRFFTQFVSYFNMRANLLGSEGARIYRDFGLKKGAGAFLGLYFFGHMVPALLHEAITRAIAGKFKKDDDDSDLTTFMSFFFGSQFREAMSLLPVVGPVGVSAVNQITREKKGFEAPITTAPSVSTINTALHTPGDFINVLRDGTHGKEAIHDSLTLLGLLTGLPTAPLSRPLNYLNDVSSGKAEPTGPIDYARGLVTGKSGK